MSFLSDPIPSLGKFIYILIFINFKILIIFKTDNTDHYATFQHVYRTETTEEFRPTYIQLQANAKSISKGILVGEKIHDYISCEYCQK